eukprot:370699-Prymnesium_polylepis.2
MPVLRFERESYFAGRKVSLGAVPAQFCSSFGGRDLGRRSICRSVPAVQTQLIPSSCGLDSELPVLRKPKTA